MGKYGVKETKIATPLNTINDVINSDQILYLKKSDNLYIRVNPVVKDMIDELTRNYKHTSYCINLSQSDVVSLAVQELYKKHLNRS